MTDKNNDYVADIDIDLPSDSTVHIVIAEGSKRLQILIKKIIKSTVHSPIDSALDSAIDSLIDSPIDSLIKPAIDSTNFLAQAEEWA